MSGQTNSWMGEMNLRPTPCIGDTIKMSSKTPTSSVNAQVNDAIDRASGSEIEQGSYSIWWLVGAAVLGYLIRGNRS